MLVYHHDYAMGAPGLGAIHPFDGYRPRRVMEDLRARFGSLLRVQAPPAPANDAQLALVHDAAYLSSIKHSRTVAQVLEIAPFALCPRGLLEWLVVRPMRWATAGTLQAARLALDGGCGINLSGGFHHAKRGNGEGFCMFADVAYAVQRLRDEGAIRTVAYVDVDAHQGNGVSSWFADDPDVRILDIFNGDIYPKEDRAARERVDVPVALPAGTEGAFYLDALRHELPRFLDVGADLVVLNVGTDVLAADLLGGLKLTLDDVRQRDEFLAQQVSERKLRTLMVPSGGYSAQSRVALARAIGAMLKCFGGVPDAR